MRGIQTDGAAIRRLRRMRGWTQDELSFESGVEVRTIRNAEQGERRIDVRTVHSIAVALGINVDEISAAPTDDERSSTNQLIQQVERWHRLIAVGDVGGLMMLHTMDSKLELPGTHDLPGGGTFRGHDEILAHYQGLLSLFRFVDFDQESYEIHAVGSMVFMRSVATIEFIPAGKPYTARHVNEFEFRDLLIARRVTSADYDELRDVIATNG